MRADWDTLTDAQKAWWLLNQAEGEGVHSWDLENLIRSKNAPQRVKDVVSHGCPVWRVTERRNGKPGVRYFLDGWEPEDATPVKPNHDAEGGGSSSPQAHPAAPLSAEPLTHFRDYTDPEGEWTVVPLSEALAA